MTESKTEQVPQQPQQVSIQELLALVGEKEVQLIIARQQIAKASEIIKFLQAQVAELSGKSDKDAKVVPKR
jgi:hypothetical protein